MKLVCERGKPYEYRDEETGQQFFSVSQVRNVMWDGFRHVPAAAMEAARLRGDAMHVYFALKLGSLVGACDPPEMIKQYAGCCRAIDNWVDEYEPTPVRIEEASCNRKLGIAGMRDADILIDSRLSIVDLKTGQWTHTDAVQVIAYGSMEGCGNVENLYDLRVYDDGTFELEEVKPIKHQADWAAFLNALQVLKWRVGR